MKKIIILGPAGAGKTTLSNKLSTTYKCDCFHFDTLKWTTPNEEKTKDEILEVFENIKKLDSWVIEGSSTLLFNLSKDCTDIIFLNIDKNTCIANLTSRGPAPELPCGTEEIFQKFLSHYSNDGYENRMKSLNWRYR